MSIIDNRTSVLNLPLPNAANALSDDVSRIVSSFNTIDGAIGTLNSGINTLNTNAEILSHKGAASGYCELDSNSYVPINRLGNLLLIKKRQTVQSGLVSSSGYAAALSVNTTNGSVSLAATATPMQINFAQGVKDYISTLGADASGILTVPQYNTSFIYADYSSQTAVTWGQTLAPPQYGYAYDRTNQSCLSLNNKSTDDFGMQWTNTSVTFSNSSPAISGTYYGVFTAALSSMVSVPYATLPNHGQGSTSSYRPPGSWTMRCKVKCTSLPGSGAVATIFGIQNAAGYGAALGIYNNAGTIKFAIWLSSNGTSQDIANSVVGTTTPNNTTWYDVELNYDAVNGRYCLFVNGVMENSVASTTPICNALTTLNVGYNFTGNIQAFEYAPYCVHRYNASFTPPTTLPDVTASGYAANFFSIPTMTMYCVSGASSSANTDPTFTAVKRVYVGQIFAINYGAFANQWSMDNYAYNGEYISAWVNSLPSNATAASFRTAIGHSTGIDASIEVKALISNLGYATNESVSGLMIYGFNYSPFNFAINPMEIGFTSGSNGFAIINKSTGVVTQITSANWKYRLIAMRSW